MTFQNFSTIINDFIRTSVAYPGPSRCQFTCLGAQTMCPNYKKLMQNNTNYLIISSTLIHLHLLRLNLSNTLKLLN